MGTFPGQPGDNGHLTDAQRAFILRQLDANPRATRREKAKIRADVEACVAAGHRGMADTRLELSLSLYRYNRERIVRDERYWNEFRQVMLGGRPMSRLEYLFPTTTKTAN